MSNSMNDTKGLFMRMDAEDLQNQFDAYNRGDQFSREGVRQLFTYLDDMAENDDRNIELDVIALCCEYTESTTADVIQDYGIELPDHGQYFYEGNHDNDGYEAAKEENVRDYLEQNTHLISQHQDNDGNDVWLFQAF